MLHVCSLYRYIHDFANVKNEYCLRFIELYKYCIKRFLSYAKQQLTVVKGEQLLIEFSHQWKNFTVQVKLLSSLFNYIETYYTSVKSMDSLVMQGLKLYQENIFEPWKSLIIEEIFQMILKEREGEIISTDIIKHALLTFKVVTFKHPEIEYCFDQKTNFASLNWIDSSSTQLEMVGPGVKPPTSSEWYQENFEKPLVDKTRKYYQQKGSMWFQRLSVIEHLLELENVFSREESHSSNFLEPSTNSLVLDVLNTELVKCYAQRLVDKETGMQFMLKHEKYDDLKKMYQLFKRVPSTIECMTACFQPYVTSRGSAITADETLKKDAIKMVTSIMNLKIELDKLIEGSFYKDIKFQKVQNIGFQTFMNEFQHTPNYLATFIDNELTKGIKGQSDVEVDSKITLFINVFVSLHSRDIFLKAYQIKLKTRLLHNSMLSRQAEDSILSKLKTECGINIVGSIHKMLLDIDESKTHMDQFKAFNKGNTLIDGMELNFKVLTYGMWPEITQIYFTIPEVMEKSHKLFEKYFISKKANTVLKLLVEDSCEISTLYLAKPYILLVNSLQLSILWSFNKQSKYSFGELKNEIGINEPKKEAEFKSCLLSLCSPTKQLIKKDEDKKPSFNENEGLQLNMEFKSTATRINFLPTKTSETQNITQESKEIIAHRDMVMDCAIVRIMKSKREVTYNNLVSDITPQIRLFPVEIAHIKKRIEALISKEYMKRKGKEIFEYIT